MTAIIAPRDLVLIRYWKHNSDGSYVICVDSAEHRDCPLVPGYVRGLLHGVYLISPPKAIYLIAILYLLIFTRMWKMMKTKQNAS